MKTIFEIKYTEDNNKFGYKYLVACDNIQEAMSCAYVLFPNAMYMEPYKDYADNNWDRVLVGDKPGQYLYIRVADELTIENNEVVKANYRTPADEPVCPYIEGQWLLTSYYTVEARCGQLTFTKDLTPIEYARLVDEGKFIDDVYVIAE